MTALEVACRRAGGGWSCSIRVGTDAGATQHTVTVDALDLERLAPGAPGPEELVRASFEFMLEREPRESILRSFDLPLIGRYFPEYEALIGARLSS